MLNRHRIVLLAVGCALTFAAVSGASRWPYATDVQRHGREWRVYFNSGPALVVPMETDTRTREQVLSSEQVRTDTARRRRALSLAVFFQSSLVVLGFLLIGTIPWVRERIG
jgi:hypothetical protein